MRHHAGMATIVIAAVGTHGDVRPGLALARRLLRAREVTLVAKAALTSAAHDAEVDATIRDTFTVPGAGR
jgi:hypothetical protein